MLDASASRFRRARFALASGSGSGSGSAHRNFSILATRKKRQVAGPSSPDRDLLDGVARAQSVAGLFSGLDAVGLECFRERQVSLAWYRDLRFILVHVAVVD